MNTLISICKGKVNSLYTLHTEMALLVTDKKSIFVDGDNPNTITPSHPEDQILFQRRY